MTKHSFLLLFLMLLTSCDPKSLEENKNNCKPYFQFDKIEHYFLSIDESTLMKMDEKETKTEKEKKQLALLIQYTPDTLSDTPVLKNLKLLDFRKNDIPADKFEQIREIFCNRDSKEIVATSCIAIYRDILIFKKNNKIVGTAKICFECDQHVITGSHQNTDDFGQSGNYKKLYKLLH